MMAVLDRPSGFSLWVSPALPDDGAKWHLLDTSVDRGALERQARSLKPFMINRRLAVVEGREPPPWSPKL